MSCRTAVAVVVAAMVLVACGGARGAGQGLPDPTAGSPPAAIDASPVEALTSEVATSPAPVVGTVAELLTLPLVDERLSDDRVIAAMLGDGRVVLLDATHGTVMAEIERFEDPDSPPSSEGHHPARPGDAMTVGGHVVFSRVGGELATPGSVHLWPPRQGESSWWSDGGDVAWHPAGGSLAITAAQIVWLVDAVSGEKTTLEDPTSYTHERLLTDPAWSRDAQLALVDWRPPPDDPAGPWSSTVVVLDPARDSLSSASRFAPPDGKVWTSPTFDADGRLLVVEQNADRRAHTFTGPARGVLIDPDTGDVIDAHPYTAAGDSAIVDQDYDPNGTTLLYVTADGVLWRQDPHTTTQLATDVRAAGW